MAKPKRRQRVVQQPGMSSEDVAKWEGAPVTTQVARDDDDDSVNATGIANGVRTGQKVRSVYYNASFCLNSQTSLVPTCKESGLLEQ